MYYCSFWSTTEKGARCNADSYFNFSIWPPPPPPPPPPPGAHYCRAWSMSEDDRSYRVLSIQSHMVLFSSSLVKYRDSIFNTNQVSGYCGTKSSLRSPRMIYWVICTGNKAAAFPLQTLGFDVDILNTVQFSNHTGSEPKPSLVLCSFFF